MDYTLYHIQPGIRNTSRALLGQPIPEARNYLFGWWLQFVTWEKEKIPRTSGYFPWSPRVSFFLATLHIYATFGVESTFVDYVKSWLRSHSGLFSFSIAVLRPSTLRYYNLQIKQFQGRTVSTNRALPPPYAAVGSIEFNIRTQFGVIFNPILRSIFFQESSKIEILCTPTQLVLF